MAIERTEGPFLTKDKEFLYLDSEIWVLPDTSYTVSYTKGKQIRYQLEKTNEEIVAVRKKSFETYQRLTGKQRDKYPPKIYPTIRQLPFGQKFISRVFTQNKLFEGSEIYETKAKTATASYRFVELQWQISGPEGEARLNNEAALFNAEKIIPGISEAIPPLQLHRTRIVQQDDPAKLIKQNPIYSNSAPQNVLDNLKSPIKEKPKKIKRKRKKRRLAKKTGKN